jgi:hypothetical protein
MHGADAISSIPGEKRRSRLAHAHDTLAQRLGVANRDKHELGPKQQQDRRYVLELGSRHQASLDPRDCRLVDAGQPTDIRLTSLRPPPGFREPGSDRDDICFVGTHASK